MPSATTFPAYYCQLISVTSLKKNLPLSNTSFVTTVTFQRGWPEMSARASANANSSGPMERINKSVNAPLDYFSVEQRDQNVQRLLNKGS